LFFQPDRFNVGAGWQQVLRQGVSHADCSD
jgi:hypothetical protein